jgi:hypothetical protein
MIAAAGYRGEADMKLSTVSLLCALMLVGCSTLRNAEPDQRLVLYQAHAGAPVASFRYLGRINSWESLGDEAIAIWTRPNEAWLLGLAGPCNGLNFTPVIGLTSQTGAVHAGFDEVLVRDPASIQIPCRIQTIRPLDVAAIREAEKAKRAGEAAPPAH